MSKFSNLSKSTKRLIIGAILVAIVFIIIIARNPSVQSHFNPKPAVDQQTVEQAISADADSDEVELEEGKIIPHDDNTPNKQEGSTAADLDESNLLDPSQRADSSFIYDTTIEALYSEAVMHNNQTVQVVGEVIGDCINDISDPNCCWITLTEVGPESEDTISVHMTKVEAQQIDTYGEHNVRGTLLQVRGTYHQVCKEHDGLSDIHSTHVQVIEKGKTTPEEFDFRSFVPGIIMIAIGLSIFAAYSVARERER